MSKEDFMILCDEFYFEITFTGAKAEIKKIAKFLKSGGLEEFFDFDDSYISFDDAYFDAADEEETWLTLSNDDYGIEIDEIDADELLEVICRAAKALHVSGSLYDINDEEYEFSSPAGDSDYTDSILSDFNDELDSYARDEEVDDEEEE